jgi:hypothetical protein
MSATPLSPAKGSPKRSAAQDSLDREALKLSVQSLQRIYAFIIALAFGNSLTKLFVNPGTQTPDLTKLFTEGGVLFACFVATVIPFFHGMNRHLDDIYALRRMSKANRGPHLPPRNGAIMVDLIVFVLEAGLLYLLAAAVLDRHAFFILLPTLLAMDIFWAMITWLITGSPALKWAAVNILALIAVLVSKGLNQLTSESLLMLLTGIVILRSVADYWFNWDFYFPPTRRRLT